jgi:hypothetical protein
LQWLELNHLKLREQWLPLLAADLAARAEQASL